MSDSKLSNSDPKVSNTQRVLAKSIDFSLVVLSMIVIPYPAGVLFGLLYILMKDALWNGQSLGKKICKLQVVHLGSKVKVPDGLKIGIRESAIRNAPLGVITFFWMVPMWGWILFFLLGLPIAVLEIYLMVKMQHGQRLGDVMADTKVSVVKS